MYSEAYTPVSRQGFFISGLGAEKNKGYRFVNHLIKYAINDFPEGKRKVFGQQIEMKAIENFITIFRYFERLESRGSGQIG